MSGPNSSGVNSTLATPSSGNGGITACSGSSGRSSGPEGPWGCGRGAGVEFSRTTW